MHPRACADLASNSIGAPEAAYDRNTRTFRPAKGGFAAPGARKSREGRPAPWVTGWGAATHSRERTGDFEKASYRIAVNFDLSPEERAFQQEVEAFLAANASPDVMDANPEQLSQTVDTPPKRAFMRKLAERGWLGMAWPTAYGGQAKS